MQKANEKTILPFVSASTQTNNATFNDSVEKAAAFCIAESSREKGEGFFKKQPPEKMIFVSKIYYPFWLSPFKEATLLLDGLSITSHTITSVALPDLKTFKASLVGHSPARQVHANFLANNQTYFQNGGEERKTVVDGFVNDDEFTIEFLGYLQEATISDKPVTDSVLITPALDETGVTKMLHSLEDERQRLVEELADLNDIIKSLNAISQESLKSILAEINTVEKKFSVQIQTAIAVLDKELARINKTYSAEVTKVSDKFEQQLTELQKKVLNLDKRKEQINAQLEQAEAEIKTAAINKDDSAEEKWKEKRTELKRELPDITDRTKELKELINQTEENRKNEMFKLKQNNDAQIKDARKDLEDIESSRDAEVKICQNEMEKIEELTANIIKQVDDWAKNREGLIIEFDELGIRQKREKALLVYMPFYLCCYQVKTQKRCIYLAPSNLSENGLSVKIKSMGKNKINQLLQPRSRKIVSVLNRFVELLDENIVFYREISEACLKANLLQLEEAKNAILSGLATLKEQHWLSDRELEGFSEAAKRAFR
ncbi:MAG: hypothetical protein ACM3JE_04825 [Betaproteobacteria bacterium]